MKASQIPVKTYVWIAMAILCLIVLLQNTGSVFVRFLFFNFHLPLILLVGIFLGTGFGWGYWFAQRKGRRGSKG